MMGRIPGDVRGGLLELFYGVYNRDADRSLDALITMGVLVRGAAPLRPCAAADASLRRGCCDHAIAGQA